MKKTLKNALITVLLLSGALINSLHAQTDKPAPTKVPDMLQNADYVFEGTVIDSKGYWTKDELGHDAIYTSMMVKVTKVFKGVGMKEGLVQLIVRGGEAKLNENDQEITVVPYYPSHRQNLPIILHSIGAQGVFAGRLVPNTMSYKWDNKIENIMLLEEQEAIGYCNICENHRYFAPWAGEYANAKELHKAIRSFNLKTDFVDRSGIVEDSLQIVQKKIDEQNAIIQKIQQEKDKKDFDKWSQRISTTTIGNQPQKKNAKSSVDTILNVDVRNYTYTTNGSNQRFLECDVYVWGNNTTYLNGLLVRFNYDKNAFGDSAYIHGALTVTLGTPFNSVNYKVYLATTDTTGTRTDISDTVMSIPIGTNDSLTTVTRVAVNTTPIQLMHIKLKIKNCAATAKMQLTDKVLTAMIFTNYVKSASATDSVLYTYNTINYTEGTQPVTLCPVTKIMGFSPSVIRAGTGEILTITGKGFGNTRGKGEVMFPDADTLGGFLPGCDTLDYTWNDTVIRVKIPTILLNTTFRDLPSVAGSGKFKVKNDLGYRDSIATNLDIEYAIENTTTVAKKKIYWAYNNCRNSAYIFKLGSSLASYPMARAVIDSAINAWARFLRIDMRLQKDSVGGYEYASDVFVNHLDTVNMLYIEDTLRNGTLMATYPNYSICGTTTRRASSDIGIKMSGINWHYVMNDTKPSGKYDFYSDVLHELGHALGLLHIINPNATTDLTNELELMFWNETLNISKSSAQRSYIGTGRQMDKKASLYLRDSSKIISWSCSNLIKIREFSSPSNKLGCVGSAISFTAYCEQLSGSPAPSYTWQHFNFTSNLWVNTTTASLLTAVTGQVSATLTITSAPASLNGKIFRCKITNIDACGPIYTQVATLSFNTPSFYANPTNQTKNEHSNFNLPAQSGDSTLQYKWQQKISGGSVYNDINDGGYFSGTTTQILSINNVPYSFDQSYFRCKGTNTAGCVGYSSAAKITVNPTGFAPSNPTNKSITESKLKIYPNPSSNLITVAIDNKNNDLQSLSILNSAGKEVYKYTFKGSSLDIDISSFPTGLYMVQLNNGTTLQNKEFVITR